MYGRQNTKARRDLVKLSSNRRIALNIVATYGRSLFALVCGLFSGRWMLMALGEVYYGVVRTTFDGGANYGIQPR